MAIYDMVKIIKAKLKEEEDNPIKTIANKASELYKEDGSLNWITKPSTSTSSVTKGSITDLSQRQQKFETDGYGMNEQPFDDDTDSTSDWKDSVMQKAQERLARASIKTPENQNKIDKVAQEKSDRYNMIMNQGLTIDETPENKAKNSVRDYFGLDKNAEISFTDSEKLQEKSSIQSPEEFDKTFKNQGIVNDLVVASRMVANNIESASYNFLLMASEVDPLNVGDYGDSEEVKAKDKKITKAIQDVIETAEKKQQELMYQLRPGFHRGFAKFTNMGITFGLAMASGAFGQPELGALMLGGLDVLPNYQEARKAGVDPNKAFLATNALWAVNTEIESVGISMFFKNVEKATGGEISRTLSSKILNKVFSVAQKGTVGFVEEGSEEVAQQTATNIMKRYTYDEQQEFFEGALESFVYGGIMGGLSSGAITTVRAMKETGLDVKISERFKVPKLKAQELGMKVLEVVKNEAVGFLDKLTGGNFSKNTLPSIKDVNRRKEIMDATAPMFQVKPGQTGRSTPQSDLHAEAQKYATPEEFINAQATTAYHGTNQAFTDFELKGDVRHTSNTSAREGVFFTSSKNEAMDYAKSASKKTSSNEKLLQSETSRLTSEMDLAQKNRDGDKYEALTTELEDLEDTLLRNDAEKLNVMDRKIDTKNFKTVDMDGVTAIDQTITDEIKTAKTKGYDGVVFKNMEDAPFLGSNHGKTTHYAVFNVEKIKTKEQLTQVWNEANSNKGNQTGIKDESPIEYGDVDEVANAIAKRYGGKIPLYHATDAETASKILKDGLKPTTGGNKTSWGKTKQVYLQVGKSDYVDSDRSVVLKIEVDPGWFAENMGADLDSVYMSQDEIEEKTGKSMEDMNSDLKDFVSYFYGNNQKWEGMEVMAMDGTDLSKFPVSRVEAGNEKGARFQTIQRTELFEDFKDLSTKILGKLSGKDFVSKQFISDLTNGADVKQVEKDIIRSMLETESGKVNVKDFAEKVKKMLLPLNVATKTSRLQNDPNADEYFQDPNKYERASLPDDTKGEVQNYRENIYESPIKTVAGEIHFRDQTGNYFGHTRVEEMSSKYMPGDKVARVIEVQSDLFQRGRIEEEKKQASETLESGEYVKTLENESETGKYIVGEARQRQKDVGMLQQYNNPTAHLRMVREELKKYNDKGYSKVLFPTGATAMKIEGLESVESFQEEGGYKIIGKDTEPKLGQRVSRADDSEIYIVSEILPNNKIKAYKSDKDSYKGSNWDIELDDSLVEGGGLPTWKARNIVTGSVDFLEFTPEKQDLAFEMIKERVGKDKPDPTLQEMNEKYGEVFDLSGGINKENPIYKFYEKTLGKYLSSNYSSEFITDENGISWYSVDLKSDKNKAQISGPVMAFQVKQYTPEDRIIDKEQATRIAGDYFTREEIDSGVIEFVDNIQTPDGLEAFGKYHQGLVSLIKNPAESTVPHEAVHYFLDNYTPNKNEIIDEVKKTQKIDDNVMAEEWLADNFVAYAKTQKIKKSWGAKVISYVQKSFNKLKVLFGSGDKITKFYDEILSKKRTSNTKNNSEAMYQSTDGMPEAEFEGGAITPGVFDETTQREATYQKHLDEYGNKAVMNGSVFYDSNLPEEIQIHAYKITEEMQIAEPGWRQSDGDGGTAFGSSTFPKWVHEDLRSKKLFQKVLNKIYAGEEMTTKPEKELVENMMEELQSRTNDGFNFDTYKPSVVKISGENVYKKGGISGKKVAQDITGEEVLTPMQNLRKRFEFKLLKERILGRTKTVEAKEKGAEKIESMKIKQEDVEGVKQVVKDYAMKNLPLEERGRLLAIIKNVKTDEELVDVLDKIDVIAEKYTVKKMYGKVLELLNNSKPKTENGVLKGKFTADTQKEIDVVRGIVQMDKNEADRLIAMNLAGLENEIPDYNIAKQNALLNTFAGLKDKSSKEITEAYAEIKALIDNGRYMRALKDFNRQVDLERAREKAIQVVSGGKGIDPGAKSIKTVAKEDMSKTASFLSFFTTLSFDDWGGLLDRMSKYDKGSLPYQSFLSTIGDVYEQEKAEISGNIKHITELKDGYSESFGFTKNSETLDQLNQDNKEVNLGIYTLANGVKIELKLSKAEARKKLMELRDSTLTDSFMSEDGMAWTSEIVQALNDFMTPADNKWMDWQMDFYKEYYKGVNEVYRLITGVDLPKNESYSPIQREGIDKIESQGFSEFLSEINTRKSVMTGSHKSRVSNIKKIKFSSDLSVIQEHIAEMEHFKAWALKLRDLRGIFGDANVRQAILQNHGKNMLLMVNDFLNKFTVGGMESKNRLKTWDMVRVRFTRGVLSLNPDLFVKQMTSMFAYLDDMPSLQWARYSVEFWKNPIENMRTLMGTDFMKERGNNMERDIKTAMASDEFQNFRKGQSFINSLMFATQLGDKGAILLGGWPVYEYNRKKFIKEGDSPSVAKEKALLVFEKTTKRAQQSGYISDQSHWQTANSLTKAFTMFKSSPNQYFRREIGALRNIYYGRGSRLKLAKTVFIYHVLLPNIFQLVGNAFKWEKEKQLQATILGAFNGMFVIGDLVDGALKKAMGIYNYNFNGLNLPVFTTYKDIEKLISAKDVQTALYALTTAGSKLSGLPIKQVVDTADGVKNMIDGDFAYGLAKTLGFSVQKPKDESGVIDKMPTKKKPSGMFDGGSSGGSDMFKSTKSKSSGMFD